jgi:transcriptional regulator with XRE-family HTH domain
MAKQPQKNGAGKRAKLKKKRRLPPGVPNPVDIHVGARLRIRRSMLGLSQEKLGDAVGLTFQQVQKYERGANRMGASRLFQFCQILGVPITYFFDDMPTGLKTAEQQVVRGLSENINPPPEPDPLARRETLELVRAYYKIADPRVRKRLFDLVKSLGSKT